MPLVRIGLISDTHGLLQPEAQMFLQGCDHIIHAGDIGKSGILEALARLAPLTVVRGNNDQGGWAEGLPDSAVLKIGGISLYALHDLAQLGLDPAAAGMRVVVSAHSHKPKIGERGGVLFVNPGSAGQRRAAVGCGAGATRHARNPSSHNHDSSHQHPTDSLQRRSAARHWLRHLHRL